MKYSASGSSMAWRAAMVAFSAEVNSRLPALRSYMHLISADSLSAAFTSRYSSPA